MIGSKANSGVKSVGLGISTQSATYGTVIPPIYGRARRSPSLTWMANLRQGGSKFGQKFSKGKKSQANYLANVDFLIGLNPIISPLQIWENQNVRLPLTFTSAVYGSGAGDDVITITDPDFYAIVGVTKSIFHVATFTDYGSAGSRHMEVTSDFGCWNAATQGPIPTFSNSEINILSSWYVWEPGMGNIVFQPAPLASYTFWYAKLDPGGAEQYNKKNANTAVPIAAVGLTWEPVCGDGPEYTGTDSTTGENLADKQILYPPYAGAGGPEFAMGGSAVPDIRIEMQGAFSTSGTGDADFVDMILDLICSGPTARGFDGNGNITKIQHGLNCYDWPGAIQCLSAWSVEHFYGSLVYGRPNTAGNILVVGGDSGSYPPAVFTSIDDDLGNTWTATLPSGGHGQFWYAINGASGPNKVTVHDVDQGWQQTNIELAGVDTFDAVNYTQNSHDPISITTTNEPGMPAIILVYVRGGSQTNLPNSSAVQPPYLWNIMTQGVGGFFIHYRIVNQPGTYTYNYTFHNPLTPTDMVIIAFKATQPSTYPQALGNFVDLDSVDLTRTQCRANGLVGSFIPTSQSTASDMLSMLCEAANCAPCFSGHKLKFNPYSEVSTIGGGLIYNAPTATGPIADLTEKDLIGDSSKPLIQWKRKDQIAVPDIIQIQHPNRNSDYNDVIIMEPETATVALMGPRKAAPVVMDCIQDPAVSRMLLGILVRRRNLNRLTYTFTMKSRWELLEQMDLITITDTLAGINQIPVRITKLTRHPDKTIDVEADPFIYGLNAPIPATVTNNVPYNPQLGTLPPNVNAPIFFEPVPRLITSGASSQLWVVVSDPGPNYGGFQAYISIDGGTSYNQIGSPITTNGITGFTVGDWPAATDPDTTNDLAVNLTESLGTLLSYQVADEDNFTYPCYVDGGTGTIPYELMTYAVADLISPNNYTLKATGAGNKLRRAVFGAPTTGAGVDHPDNSRFAFVGPPYPGILKLDMDPLWIGKTLHFKFPVFNSFQNALESITDAVDYTYTPVGTAAAGNPNQFNYTIDPPNPLSNPTSTTIHMVDVTATFPSNVVHYNARTFTIPAPSVPTTYYVTIADPGYVGDSGTSTNLTATAQTSNALVGVAGNTYIGSIIVQPAGGGTTQMPGGSSGAAGAFGDIVLVNGQ